MIGRMSTAVEYASEESSPWGALKLIAGNAKDEILIPATGLAESMKESATMHERGVPYRIGNQGSAGTLYVGSTATGAAVATLTIEPGVIVRVKKGGVIYIESSSLPAGAPARGALIAVGTVVSEIAANAGSLRRVIFCCFSDPSAQYHVAAFTELGIAGNL